MAITASETIERTRRAPVRTKPRGSQPLDIKFGERLRAMRLLRGMSQGQLGAAIGLSFQQVQKYEKGSNRISAARLAEFSDVLDCALTYFFDGIVNPQPSPIGALLETRSRFALELLRGFEKIPQAVQADIYALVQALARAPRAAPGV